MEWETQPALFTLAEVAGLIRKAPGTCRKLLSRDKFPIAHVPGARPYLFPVAHVRAYVELGRATNPALAAGTRQRRYFAAVSR